MALPIILLISEEKIKSFTSINFNVSPTELVPFIMDAQNMLMPNYIGATYYNALRERIENGTLTSADIFLLDNYIGQMLCNWGLYYALPFIKYQIYNKGVLSGTSENGETITLEELKFLQSQTRTIAENYSQSMVQYLLLNSEDYPLYNAPNIKDGQLPDKSNAFTTNVVIPHYAYAGQQRALRAYGDGLGYGNGLYYNGYVGPDCYNLPNSGN